MVIRVLKNKWGFCPSHYITIVPPQSYVTSVIGWLPFLFSSRQPRPPLNQLRAHVLLFAVSHFFTQYGSDSRVYLSDKVAPGVSVWRACPSSLLKNRKGCLPFSGFSVQTERGVLLISVKLHSGKELVPTPSPGAEKGLHP
jgi:hypothetical protein